jgi:PAS domain S-box-containing protein
MVVRPTDWLQRVALSLGVMVSIAGALFLTAWAVHFVPLLQLSPGMAPLTREAALTELLLGAALTFLATGRKRAAVICATVALVIAVTVGMEYALNRSLGIDELLGKDYINRGESPPGRMSPTAMLCYLSASLALLALSIHKPVRYAAAIAGVVASMLLAVGSVMFLAYALDQVSTYRWGHFRAISIQAAVVVGLLGAGIMALAIKASSMVPRWFPLALALGLSVGALGIWQALMLHQESQLPLLSHIVLAGGIVGAVLIAIAVSQTQKARLRSRQVQEGKEAFERLFDASLDALLVVDRNGRILSANASVQHVFGYTRDEIVSITVEKLVPDHLRDQHRIHREGYYAAPRARPMGKDLTLYGCRRDGSEFPVDVSLSPVQWQGELHVMAAVRDITAQKQAQEVLRQSEDRLRGLFEQTPIGIILADRDHHVIKVNAKLCRMLGYSEAELIGKTPLDITHPDDRQETANAMELRFTNENAFHKLEKRYVKKSGEVIWGSVTASVIHDGNGEPLYAMGMIEDVTERKRAEEELRTLTQRLSLATRIASIGVWDWDLRTNLEVWNDATFEMVGLPKVNPVPHEGFIGYVHPDDVALVRATTQAAIRLKTQQTMEYRVIRSDGVERQLSVAAGAVFDEHGQAIRVVGTAIDITDRKCVEEELRALTQRLSLATRSASMGVWELDLARDVAIWDGTMFQIFGIPKQAQVSRQDWMRLVHPDDLRKMDDFVNAIVRDKMQHTIDFRMIQPDGSLRYLSTYGAAVVDDKDNVTGVVGIALDITERKQLQEDLDAAREQAIASARLSALGMMASGVAHEINNPLSIIHAMASDLGEMVAEQGSASPQVIARNSRVISETAERIAKIVKSLRQISREGASDPLRPTPLAKIVADTLEICRAKFRAHGVELILPQAIPELSVPCREVQIAQALLNLLQNALDAVLEGDGEHWVRLEIEPRHDSVALSVIDSGPGIPLEIRTRVMEPFFTTKPVGKGTGLGLSLSKTIAEDHGGSLEHGEDHGHTRFSMILPLARGAGAA